MPITPAQKQVAESHQRAAASDGARYIRLIAGPGTGKSHTIELRVGHLLQSGADPGQIYVISFTRATKAELRERIINFGDSLGLRTEAEKVVVTTLHSLALRILKQANLLIQFPTVPTILDSWEQREIYDAEFADAAPCKSKRAAEIRNAHDASWQTLSPASLGQAQVSHTERQAFERFHSTRSNLYSCVLPGEVIHRCVTTFQQNVLQANQLPLISHLIVDEYQDLNACDQSFVRMLTSGGATLFIAGDDDQSIYSFRHADPSGIVNFPTNYQGAVTHELTDCFRCAPIILDASQALIAHNVNREQKHLDALYGHAIPPVNGQFLVWSFVRAEDEARAIAESCRSLIDAGMAGKEDQILILLAQARPSSMQLDLLTRELGNLDVPYSTPRGAPYTDDPSLRAVLALMRLVCEGTTGEHDYLPYRTILKLLDGVGAATIREVIDGCIVNNCNFRALFTGPMPHWLSTRAQRAVARVTEIAAPASSWTLGDTLQQRLGDIADSLQRVFAPGGAVAAQVQEWVAFASGLPLGMTLGELLEYLGATNESEQATVLSTVNARLNIVVNEELSPSSSASTGARVRILTMHGAKGLSGSVVFIPGLVQGILPDKRAVQAPGLLMEKRRLFYVSLTRAKATCIVSHASKYSGQAATLLRQQWGGPVQRSQFLGEMQAQSVSRSRGLSAAEASAILADIANL